MTIGFRLVAFKFNLKVVEDAAEGFGTKYRNKYVGTFGDIGVYSFNGNKIITTGAGGLIVTKNLKLEKKIRHIISQSKIISNGDIYSNELGFNLKMNALSASLGIAQLKKVDKILHKKKKLHNFYINKFKSFENLKIIQSLNNKESNHWINILSIQNIKKDEKNFILKKFKKLKYEVKPIWYPLHKMKYLKKYPKMNLRNSEIAYATCIALPSSIGSK